MQRQSYLNNNVAKLGLLASKGLALSGAHWTCLMLGIQTKEYTGFDKGEGWWGEGVQMCKFTSTLLRVYATPTR